MRMCGLSQLIDVPTRVTDLCASIIDLIMVTDQDKISQSGVLGIGLSDHMLIYCKRAAFNDHNTVRMRSLNRSSCRVPGAGSYIIYTTYNTCTTFIVYDNYRIHDKPEESSMYTTFNTPFGRHRHFRLPIGINSAPDIY